MKLQSALKLGIVLIHQTSCPYLFQLQLPDHCLLSILTFEMTKHAAGFCLRLKISGKIFFP